MSKPDTCSCSPTRKECMRNRAFTMPGQEPSKLRANRDRLRAMKQQRQKGRHARPRSLESSFPPQEFQDLPKTCVNFASMLGKAHELPNLF
ncbi:hypothetical protein PoB_005324500 [Plakobranchus ocellatus]|uniref:Uncharacterized protein n=1 Tax=Plakobranchus ocellatus TaxID=259542 RepID=A0AAV4C248_9GAST|nr:hypothetical protein PoB_005324500 [Plakobranchus ocellatus]